MTTVAIDYTAARSTNSIPKTVPMADSPSLKIALLSDWFLPHRGGIEIQMHDLAQQLTRAGHTVHVITPIPGPTEIGAARVHRLRAPLAPQFGFVYTRAPFREMAALFQRERYDVVHCHTSYIAPTAFGGAYLSQKLGIPTVITFHSELSHFTHVLAMCNRWLHWSSWPVLFAGVSPFINAGIARLVAPRPVHLLPNGIDIPFWKASPPIRPRSHEIVLITVTRFSPRKRVAALLCIFAALKSQVSRSIALKLIVVGDGALRLYLQHLVKVLGLEDAVEMVGYQSRTMIRHLFARADLFVSTCAIESFGLAALEARCAGLPIVARSSGIDQFVQHGREGLLAANDRDLTGHLRRLIEDPELRLSIAQHNWATTPPFSWDNVIAQHLTVYHESKNLVIQ